MALITFNGQEINPNEISQINKLVQDHNAKWYFLVFLSGVVYESARYTSQSQAESIRNAFITQVGDSVVLSDETTSITNQNTESGSITPLKIWAGTLAEYNAFGTGEIEEDTFYFIEE